MGISSRDYNASQTFKGIRRCSSLSMRRPRFVIAVKCHNHANHKVGDHLLVKLSGGRIVEATIKAVVEMTEGVRLQVSFGEETALIYPWQIVLSDA